MVKTPKCSQHRSDLRVKRHTNALFIDKRYKYLDLYFVGNMIRYLCGPYEFNQQVYDLTKNYQIIKYVNYRIKLDIIIDDNNLSSCCLLNNIYDSKLDNVIPFRFSYNLVLYLFFSKVFLPTFITALSTLLPCNLCTMTSQINCNNLRSLWSLGTLHQQMPSRHNHSHLSFGFQSYRHSILLIHYEVILLQLILLEQHANLNSRRSPLLFLQVYKGFFI